MSKLQDQMFQLNLYYIKAFSETSLQPGSLFIDWYWGWNGKGHQGDCFIIISSWRLFYHHIIRVTALSSHQAILSSLEPLKAISMNIITIQPTTIGRFIEVYIYNIEWGMTRDQHKKYLGMDNFCVCFQPMRDEVTSYLIGWTHAQNDPCRYRFPL